METGLRNSFWASPDTPSRAPDVQVSSPLPSLCLAGLEAPYAVLLETHSLTTSHPRTRVLHKQGPKLHLNLVTFSFFFFLKEQNTILVTVLRGGKVLFVLMIHFGGFGMMLY